jgi:peptidyl-tRNA hydrolase
MAEEWQKTYEKEIGTKYAFVGEKDGKLVKGLLAAFGYEKLCRIATAFIKDNDDEFVAKSGHTIGVFKVKAQQIAEKLAERVAVREKPEWMKEVIREAGIKE